MSTDFDYSLHIFRAPHLREIVEAAVQFFARTPVHKLPPATKFDGTGVYGVYYVGDHPLYTRLSLLNRDTCTYPIYVGKAVPPGWRTARSRHSATPALYRRLREHARSITQAVD
ncbi:MAG: Eco29kI family restriction endonuclease, partial [Chloroflexi bacterium]